MKVTVNRASLVALIANIIKFTDANNLMAASGCLSLNASEGKLTVTSLNERKYASGSIEAEAEESGEIMVNSGKLDAAIACFTTDTITVTADDKSARISASSKRTKVALRLFGGEKPKVEFPEEEQIEFAIYKAPLFASVLQAVCNATADKNNPRDYLNTVCFEKDEKNLRVVGTDSNALSLCSLDCENAFDKVLIPQESVRALMVAIESFGGADVKVASVKKGLMVTSGNYRFFMRGNSSPDKYPMYMKVIPQYKGGLEIDADNLSKAIKSISKVSESRAKHIILNLEKEGITVSGINGGGELSATQEAEDFVNYSEGVTGPENELKLRVNYELLLQCLNSYKGKKITFSHAEDSAKKPLKITQADDERALVYVIMPAVSA